MCDFCGMEQTLPKIDSPEKIELFVKANDFRLANRFDIAKKQYEQIIAKYPDDNEAYWCKLLCVYGIEYIDDDLTERKIPTCHRTIKESIFTDKDYKLIISRATPDEKAIYETEAKEIDRIQKEILLKAGQEEPYDIFICFKDSDENGKRTLDSQYANKIYTHFTNNGYKVFFSRVTLKSKVGSEYEPIIYSALSTAKVMLLVCANKDYINAPWVRNEWSRFLEFIKSDYTKVIVPCLKDVYPYDLPDELARVQVMDMGELDFYENLTRQIDSKFGRFVPPPQPVVEPVSQVRIQENATKIPDISQEDVIMKGYFNRIKLFLADNEWKKVDDYAERILDLQIENAEAYVFKLMAELKVESREKLKDCAQPFDQNVNYKRACTYGDESLRKELKGYNDFIINRIETARLNEIYERGLNALKRAKTENDYKEAGKIFDSIKDYKDAKSLAQDCYLQARNVVEQEKLKAENERKDGIYQKAKKLIGTKALKDQKDAVSLLESIAGWKDSSELIADCKLNIVKLEAELKEKNREKEYCQKLIKDLESAKSGSDIEKTKKESNQKILKLEKEKDTLIDLLNKYPDIEARLVEATNNLNNFNKKCDKKRKDIKVINQTITKYKQEKDSLGIFAFKRKKELEELIRGEESKLSALKLELDEIVDADPGYDTLVKEIKKERKGYNSIKEIETDLKKTKQELTQNQQKIDSSTKTKEDIISELKKYSYGISLLEEYKLNKIAKLFNISQSKAGSLGVGDTVKFGKYSQDGDEDDKDPIEWDVLEKNGDKVLLISSYSLENKIFDTFSGRWGSSSLHYWLVTDFIEKAFSNEERAKILTRTATVGKNPKYNFENKGDCYEDKVFLLNIDEAKKYFKNDLDRVCRLTPNASPGFGRSDDGWWLCSPGKHDRQVAYVTEKGEIDYEGLEASEYGYCGVRPAIWVSLS